MTKEEAANHIRYGIIEENYHLPKELGIEACEMAIKALEQQPCEDAELVSIRQELLERGDELVSFRHLVERFEGVEKEYKGVPWNLKQIYNNFNILIGEEPCDDCISRDEAIRVAEQGQIQGYEWQFKKLCNLPSVTPQPKMGHWIKYGIPRCGEQHYKCTSCGYYINFGQWGELYSKEFKYCPNCAAKMQEAEE